MLKLTHKQYEKLQEENLHSQKQKTELLSSLSAVERRIEQRDVWSPENKYLPAVTTTSNNVIFKKINREKKAFHGVNWKKFLTS